MSRIMCTSSPKVKATRKTSRPSAPFGAGLLPKPYRRFEPSDAERKWAAAAFADDASPDYDQLAGEAAFLASYEAMTPPFVRPAGRVADLRLLRRLRRRRDRGDHQGPERPGRAGLSRVLRREVCGRLGS